MALPTTRAEAKRLGFLTYYTGKLCPKNHDAARRADNGRCIVCAAEQCARRRSDLNPIDRIHEYAKARARHHGTEFTITVEDLLPAPHLCPICSNYLNDHSSDGYFPSLDRVDNSIGYTPTNTRIICHTCNTLKSNHTSASISKLIAHLYKIQAYMKGHNP